MEAFEKAKRDLSELIAKLTPEERIQYNQINQKLLAIQNDKTLTAVEKMQKIKEYADKYSK